MMNKTTAEPKKIGVAFSPQPPDSLEALDIPDSLVEDLMLRRLYSKGSTSMTALCSSLKLPYQVIHELFQRLRRQQLFEVLGVKDNDYTFTLSGAGRDQAERRFTVSHYAGPAPVSLQSYDAAVRAQAAKVAVNRAGLEKALSDLVLTKELLDQIGPAMNSQTSLFLYGPTGNGKTSVVGELGRIYQDAVVIPYAVEFDGQVIVLYDPAVHERLAIDVTGLDPRWVVCRRPAITVGGELEPSMLELQLEESSRVYAAPLQMRANNGMLIIDDFGRQIVTPHYLLNRWIVPLDRRVDYLSFRYGLKFEIPFELLVVFATNLDPQELADEAFLRRIQNKIYVGPVEAPAFEEIFNRLVQERNLPSEPGSAEFLRTLCLQLGKGELRACYPADILNILASVSTYEEVPAAVNKANLKRAAAMYFTKTLTVKGERPRTQQEVEPGGRG